MPKKLKTGIWVTLIQYEEIYKEANERAEKNAEHLMEERYDEGFSAGYEECKKKFLDQVKERFNQTLDDLKY